MVQNLRKPESRKRIFKRMKDFRWELVPFFLVALIIPIITFHIPIPLSESMKRFVITFDRYDDYFHLIKVIILFLSTVLSFVLFILKWDKEKQLPSVFLLILLYSVLTFLSIVFSDYKTTAILGIFDHYEGGLTQQCYVAVLIFSYCLCSRETLTTILKTMLWAGLVVASIGLLQFFGIDPLYGGLVGDASQIGGASFTNTISSTIGNSNYTGTYAVILLPISITVMLQEKNNVKKVMDLILFFGAAFFLLLGSMSRAGYFGFLVCLPVYFILMRGEIKRQLPWIISAGGYAVVIFLLTNIASGGFLWHEVKSLNPFLPAEQSNEKLVLQNISMEQDCAAIKTNKWYLTIQNAENEFLLVDNSGKEIPSSYDDNYQMIQLTQKPYKDIRAYMQKKDQLKWIYIEMEGKDIEFVHTGQEMKVVGFNSVLTDIIPVQSSPLIKNESFASGRGYIWSRAIPLLRKAIFLGYGPDTFPYIFPQNDIVGKLNYGAIWVIIGKPHNWYLQIALGSGVLSLLCLLGLFIWYGIQTVKTFWHGVNENQSKMIAFGILTAVVGYLATGLFNDSIISVSPLFWMLIGFGIRLVKPVPPYDQYKEYTGRVLE